MIGVESGPSPSEQLQWLVAELSPVRCLLAGEGAPEYAGDLISKEGGDSEDSISSHDASTELALEGVVTAVGSGVKPSGKAGLRIVMGKSESKL